MTNEFWRNWKLMSIKLLRVLPYILSPLFPSFSFSPYVCLFYSQLRCSLKFKESWVIHSLAVSQATAKDIFERPKKKSRFWRQLQKMPKISIAFLILFLFFCYCFFFMILLLLLLLFSLLVSFCSRLGSKLKSHFAFNWYSLTPQKRPNEFDVKTFGTHPANPPRYRLRTTLPAPKNFYVQTVVPPGSPHYLSCSRSLLTPLP